MATQLTAQDFEELFGVNAGYVEKVYQDFLASPDSVGDEWQRFFHEHGIEPAAKRTARAPAKPPAPEPEPEPAPEPESEPEPPSRKGEEPLRGVAARIARNMEESLTIPTATSSRVIPVKVLEENRRVINQQLMADYRGKVSFTHLVAWAMVQALKKVPAMARSYAERDGRPHRVAAEQINLGIAVDLEKPDGSRTLVVPNIKDCGSLDFAAFVAACDEQVDNARGGSLSPEDFQDTTCTLTNPGTIGTQSSLPRLMPGQGFIFATGAIGVPAEYAGASDGTLSELGISKVMTVSSTYDHRVIQGADSGEYLAVVHRLLAGEERGFYEGIFHSLLVPHQPMHFSRDRRPAAGSPLRASEALERAAKVMQYIRAYRVRGYLLADIDPLSYEIRRFPELEMSAYGLTIWDLDREFFTTGTTGRPIATLREIREVLRATYTRHVGVEFMHIADPEQKSWLQERMEADRNAAPLAEDTQLQVLDSLIEAEAFERFLHTRFVGHKRFSLEGAETLVPTLEALLDRAAAGGCQRVVLGMAHRGRLNVLAHVLHKPLTKIFSEFEGHLDPDMAQGSGDVKYHVGATGRNETWSGDTVTVELASNPSHLEAVDPVVQGMARARQDHHEGGDGRARILPVLVHGDAAFAGQGVVSETLNMSQLHGYRTGGTVHVIVNNQIGYTTPPEEARSTHYCSDMAKAIQAPVFHVNGDDPLAAVRMIRLAFDYREEFGRDVVLDIVCYRRHGHNEGDEPSFTQPLLYRKIQSHSTVRERYQEFLVRAGVIAQEDLQKFDEKLQDRLKSSLDEVRQATPPEVEPRPRSSEESWPDRDTAYPLDKLRALTETMSIPPEDMHIHEKVRGILKRRVEMIQGRGKAQRSQPVDFALAEQLAFASLLVEGVEVRLAGQDSGRGTFSQRHSVLVDIDTGEKYLPLNFLEEGQARYLVVDSLLSEEAALGFEYGYSVVCKDGLTLWEAQFGDFANGAQIQVDQFIASGHAKWGQASGLVLLLPHGHDGQGPEHSSARPERFLQLCAENNMRVVNPSTAAQYFHVLRKQALDEEKKPLVVLTPKSLLRQKVAGSTPEQLAGDSFQPVIGDDTVDPKQVRRVILCSGKVYYDLEKERGEEPVALVRVEQLYPWPGAGVEATLERYPQRKELVWCQEEPRNMGAYTHALQHQELDAYAGRPAAASPATGFLRAHKVEQAALVKRALAGEPGDGA